MKQIFCPKTRNVMRFMEGLDALKSRGAAEASWMLVEAEPGLGKSSLFGWYSVQNDVPLIRAKAGWTLNWMLRDLAEALYLEPRPSAKQNIEMLTTELIRLGEPLIMVDEINHAARSVKVLETLRDLTDLTQAMLIVGGHKGMSSTLKAYKQIYDRISSIVEFQPATKSDVATLCAELSDVVFLPCAHDEILARTNGTHRLVMNAVARAERAGQRSSEPVSAAMLKRLSLSSDLRPRG